MKNIFTLLMVILLMIGLVIALKQVQLTQIFRPKANAIGVTLSLVPSQVSLQKGEEATLDLTLNAVGDQVTAIELELETDSSVIEVTDIIPTKLLPQIIAMDLSKPNQAEAILVSNPSSVTQGTVAAKIKIKGKNPGSTILKFSSTTKVSAVGKTGDVLAAVESATITVGQNNQLNIVALPTPEVNHQADELIDQYLAASPAGEEKPKSTLLGTYQTLVTDYIKNIIGTINTRAEKEARKYLD